MSERDETTTASAQTSPVGYIGKTVVVTLVVVITLAVLIAVFVVAFYMPRRRADEERSRQAAAWVKCAEPHIDAMNYWLRNGNINKAEAEKRAADACGPAPE